MTRNKLTITVRIRECVECGHSRYTDADECSWCGSNKYIKKDGVV